MANHASVQGAAPLLSVYATLDDHSYGRNDCYGHQNPYKELERSLPTTMRDGQYTLIWKAFQSGVVISLCDVSDDSHELINHCLVESDDHAAADNNRCT
jgi:hypothetical protein